MQGSIWREVSLTYFPSSWVALTQGQWSAPFFLHPCHTSPRPISLVVWYLLPHSTDPPNPTSDPNPPSQQPVCYLGLLRPVGVHVPGWEGIRKIGEGCGDLVVDVVDPGDRDVLDSSGDVVLG